MEVHHIFMQRCFDLARLGAGEVSPNPMVGAVLVYDGKIIGEGWHQRYGSAHAEVNCIASVKPEDRALIPDATLYCSLEPCFHFGKTPPCVDLVLQKGIQSVVVSNLDPNPLTAGKSLKKLEAAGVKVVTGILEQEGQYLNRAFFTWITEKRPYIILKWAQSMDGYIGRPGERTPVSEAPALRYVHRLRAASDAILVGTNTALTDNPRLDTRFYPHTRAPLRIVYDRAGKISNSSHLLDDSVDTWVAGPVREGIFQRTVFIESKSIPDLLERLKAANKATVLIEGGPTTHEKWISANYWDEIQIIQSAKLLGNGIIAPRLPSGVNLREKIEIGNDKVLIFTK